MVSRQTQKNFRFFLESLKRKSLKSLSTKFILLNPKQTNLISYTLVWTKDNNTLRVVSYGCQT